MDSRPSENYPQGSLWGLVNTKNERKVAAFGALGFVVVTLMAILLTFRTELLLRDAEKLETAGRAHNKNLAKDAVLLPVNLSVTLKDGKATLRGMLPNETAHRDIIARARSLWGNDAVVDRLEVKTDIVQTPWFDSVLKWFPPNIPAIKSGEITISGLEVLLFGEVPGPDERDAAGKLITALAGSEAKIHNGLRVATKSASGVSATPGNK